MTIFPLTSTQPQKIDWRATAVRAAAILFIAALSAAIILGWDQIERIGAYGYPAIFLVSLLSSATLLLPAPGVALIASMGSFLDPMLVGVIAGLGAALGEMTAYIAGYYGNDIIQDKPHYMRLEKWMRNSSSPVIFILAAIPNPIFDVGGLIAGVIRMPAWRFILITWLGKSLRFGLLASVGAAAL